LNNITNTQSHNLPSLENINLTVTRIHFTISRTQENINPIVTRMHLTISQMQEKYLSPAVSLQIKSRTPDHANVTAPVPTPGRSAARLCLTSVRSRARASGSPPGRPRTCVGSQQRPTPVPAPTNVSAQLPLPSTTGDVATRAPRANTEEGRASGPMCLTVGRPQLDPPQASRREENKES
jgi:hypothetical protein